MGSDKTYIFDGGGTGGGLDIAALVSSMMSNKGMDPNLVAALMNGNNNRGSWGGDGCWWIWIILLFFCWGGNGFGFGGNGANGLPAQLNGDAGRELLMNAIQGNGTAITQLASSLNCSTQQIQSTLCNIQSTLGMSSQQIINAVQSMGCQIGNQIAACCCDMKQAINGVNVGMERGFSSVAYETQRQTCDLQNTIRETSQSGTTAIISKLDQMQAAALQDKIDALREKNSTLTTQLRRTVMIVGLASSPAEFLNSFEHELRHLVDDIASTHSMDMAGEEVAYLTGDINTALWSDIHRFTCCKCDKHGR